MKDSKYTVLAADDETELLDALELFLRREDILLFKAVDGFQALEQFSAVSPDLLLLDIMMPGLDGFAVLQKVRETSRVPAIMVTARGEDYDKILGLELGADDYITKPYNPMEVTARVKAQLRRCYHYTGNTAGTDVIRSFDLVLNRTERSVTRGGLEVNLTGTEYKILELLMKSPGRIYTKQQIFEYAWNEPFLGDDSTVMVHISNLRSKIGDDSKKPQKIRTVKGLGYRFEKET